MCAMAEAPISVCIDESKDPAPFPLEKRRTYLILLCYSAPMNFHQGRYSPNIATNSRTVSGIPSLNTCFGVK